MTVNLQKTQYISLLSGFKNKNNYSLSHDVASYNLSAGQAVQVIINLVFSNPDAVLGNLSSTQVKYDGIESFWRLINGFGFSQQATYEIGSLTYFSPTTYTLYTYLANETGGNITSPAFTIRIRLNMYDMPFV